MQTAVQTRKTVPIYPSSNRTATIPLSKYPSRTIDARGGMPRRPTLERVLFPRPSRPFPPRPLAHSSIPDPCAVSLVCALALLFRAKTREDPWPGRKIVAARDRIRGQASAFRGFWWSAREQSRRLGLDPLLLDGLDGFYRSVECSGMRPRFPDASKSLSCPLSFNQKIYDDEYYQSTMSQVMLPNSQNGISKTHTERVQAEPRIEQPPGGIKVHVEDPEDPPGEEMTKTARVWKTYVREADQLDKEMVEGRNSFCEHYTMLSVVITFVDETTQAALFSAISTAFIIESLGDLKPDTAESSARSLLAISQNLDAIVTGQQPTSLPAQTASFDDFSPSRSAVVVNILWLLSLSLSVAVSLIAMLAKEWYYKFMTGRSGPVYNQARKRQQKWNGIERWKMQELVNMLPGLMHAALLLFAVGLCIYLWDIHTGVAVVVTVVTTLAGCIYTLTTVLPLFDGFCPYSTPVTLLLNLLRRVLHIMVQYEYHRAHHSDRLESLLAYLTDILNPNWGKAGSQGKADIYAHMDTVTSQILAWMIVNCEDSRSVHVAYQAIAGAHSTLPLGPVLECEASYSIRQHVRSLVQLSTESGRYSLRDPNMLQAALRYCRAASVLEHGELLGNSPYYTENYRDIAQIHVSLIDMTMDGVSAILSPGLTVNVAACLTFGRINRLPFISISNRSLENVSSEPAITQAISILRDYASGNPSSISAPAILVLVESYAYYISKHWYTMKEAKRSSAVVQLVRIYIQSGQHNRRLAQAASFALAAASFAVNSYPGGDHSPEPSESRTNRALQVLESFLSSPDEWNSHEAFTFGFIGLLPHIGLSELHSHSSLTSKVYAALEIAVLGSLQSPFTVPAS
ncbi:transmembrane protein [Ceratobasidium sp. AG-Ba]|nr:transmembrane protein [Ceratobasidium sp. AG-Ba]